MAIHIFAQIDGSLSLSEKSLHTASSVLVNGELSISGSSASTLGGSLSLSSTGIFTIAFESIYDPDTYETIGVTAGGLNIASAAILGGTLRLSFDNIYSFFPDFVGQYVILSAATLSGTFANAMNGGRVSISRFGELDAAAGSFLVTYDSRAVTLSDFQAIPEPSTWALLSLALAFFIFKSRRKKLGHLL